MSGDRTMLFHSLGFLSHKLYTGGVLVNKYERPPHLSSALIPALIPVWSGSARHRFFSRVILPGMSTVAENLELLEERIERACARAGRSRESLRLMAVGKRQPLERVREALELGLRLFGENRVQEMQSKREIFPEGVEVHLIGHLQRNKARDAALLFDAVQSLDAERTVRALEERVAALDRTMPVLVEVNTSGEASKYGVRDWEQLLGVALAVEDAPHLVLTGLMTLGPISDDESRLRDAFRSLRSFRERLEVETGRSLPELSMGMSNDIEAAVLEGSTLLRVGTALFGTRQYQPAT